MNKNASFLSSGRPVLNWSNSVRQLKSIALLAAAPLVAVGTLRAANDAWSTTPADNTFTGINWTTGTTTPGAPTGTIASGDALYFGTSSVTTLNENEAAGFTLAGFIFNADGATPTSAYTISGNSFALTGGITNSSSVLQTINDAFTMTNGGGFFTTAGGLTLGGNITQTNTAGAFTFAGPVGGAATGGGTVTLGGTDVFTYSGDNISQVVGGATLAITGNTTININSGYFALGQGGAGAGTVTVAAGGSLTLTGGNFFNGTFGGGNGIVNINGTLNSTGQFRLGYNASSTTNLNAGGVFNTGAGLSIASVAANSAAAFNFNGGTLRPTAAVTLFTGNATITTITTSSTASTIDANSFASSVALPIVDGATAGGLTIIDSSTAKGGVITLASNSTYTGGTIVNSGTLALGAGGGAGAVRGVLTVNAGATLNLTVNNALGYTAGTQVTTLNINGGTVNTTGAVGDEGYLTSFNLTGGTLSYTGTNVNNGYQIAAGSAAAPGITSNASPNLSLISGGVNIRSGTLPINVAKGTTAGGVDLQISGVVSGAGFGVAKGGAGTLLLTAVNTYTGATAVNAGALFVGGGGSTAAGSAVTVSNAGTILGGVGAFNGTVAVGSGATLTAGSTAAATTPTVGALTTGALTLATGSAFNAVLASNTSFSTLAAAGTTALGGAAFGITLTPGATFTSGALELITSAVSGTFTNSVVTTGGYTFTADYTTNPGFFDVDVAMAAVPEPSTWVAGVVMVGLLGVTRRRQVNGWLRAVRG